MGERLLRVFAGICLLALIVAPLATVGVAQQGSGGLAASLPTLTSPGPSTIDNCGPATFTITVHDLAGGQRAQGQLTALFILPGGQRQVVSTTPIGVSNPAGSAPISFSRSISLPPASQRPVTVPGAQRGGQDLREVHVDISIQIRDIASDAVLTTLGPGQDFDVTCQGPLTTTTTSTSTSSTTSSPSTTTSTTSTTSSPSATTSTTSSTSTSSSTSTTSTTTTTSTASSPSTTSTSSTTSPATSTSSSSSTSTTTSGGGGGGGGGGGTSRSTTTSSAAAVTTSANPTTTVTTTATTSAAPGPVEVLGAVTAPPAGEMAAAPAGEEVAGEVAGPAPAQVPSAQPARPVRLPSTGAPSVPPAAVLLVLTAGAGVYLSRFGGKRR